MQDSTLLSHWLPAALLWVLSPATLALGLVLNTRDIAAPYGRHSGGARHAAWGPLVNGRVAWITQELPALAVPLLMLAWRGGSGASSTGPCTALGAAFITHYAYRACVYPLRMRGVKGTALTVWLMAAAFCTLNGFTQGWFLLHECPADPRHCTWQLHHVLGLALWLLGWLTNLHADGILRRLRTGNNTGYKVPRGGLFELVSCANYTAECVEWGGWALAGWGLAPASFAAFTVANLAPRAQAHHEWLKQQFKEYPGRRRAFVPFLW